MTLILLVFWCCFFFVVVVLLLFQKNFNHMYAIGIDYWGCVVSNVASSSLSETSKVQKSNKKVKFMITGSLSLYKISYISNYCLCPRFTFLHR